MFVHYQNTLELYTILFNSCQNFYDVPKHDAFVIFRVNHTKTMLNNDLQIHYFIGYNAILEYQGPLQCTINDNHNREANT